MKSLKHLDSQENHDQRRLDSKLTAYLASAGFVGAAIASTDANAAVVSSGPLNVQFGPANGGPGHIDLDMDIDSDGELEFQLRHRDNSIGEDYLELDKSPDENTRYPDNNVDGDNENTAYIVDTLGDYPQSLAKGVLGGTSFSPPAGLQYEDWQDTTNYQGGGTTRLANRLIDYDSGVDAANWNPPPSSPGFFTGQEGVPQYVGFQIDFDDAGPFHYGWIGVVITDDATASGELIGYAYDDVPLTPVLMGFHIPEPATMGLVALGGVTIASSWLGRKIWRK